MGSHSILSAMSSSKPMYPISKHVSNSCKSCICIHQRNRIHAHGSLELSLSLGRWTRKPRLSQVNRCLTHTHSQPPVLMGVRCLYQNAPILLMPKQAPQAMSFTGNLTSKPRSAVGNIPFREHHDDPIIQLGSSRIRGVLRGPPPAWMAA